MNLPSLKIGELTARLPIIQGGMGIGISMSGLAGAVAREGGIGVISAAQPGFNESDFFTHTFEANYRVLAEHLKKARDTAKNGIIGVNIMCRGRHYEEYVKCAVKNAADIIFSGAGLPMDLPGLVEGSKTKIAPIISTAKAARVLLTLWDRHHGRTADLVVIEGPKAGGHLGYTREQVAEHGGGIFDKKGIEHYLSLGLSGVQMATRFVATKECDAAQAFKEMYVRAKKEDITLVESPVHMVGRALRNPFVKRVSKEREQPTNCFGCLKTCDPKTTRYCITMALIRAARGDVDNALVFCGENAWRVNKIQSVHELMTELSE